MAIKWFQTAAYLAKRLTTTPGALRVKLGRAGIKASRMSLVDGKWTGEYDDVTVTKIEKLYAKPPKIGRPKKRRSK